MPVGLDATVVSGGVDYGHGRRPLPVGKALDDALHSNGSLFDAVVRHPVMVR